MVEMELVGVRVELPSNAPIVLLRETGGERRLLPIFIGGPEATAIAYALENVTPPRPQTHDLMKNLLDELGVRVEQVVVTELRDRTFFAELRLRSAGGSHSVSSRPSDAIALAARTGTPIYVSEAVLAEAAYREDDDRERSGESDEMVEQFRQFIENVNPEDFV